MAGRAPPLLCHVTLGCVWPATRQFSSKVCPSARDEEEDSILTGGTTLEAVGGQRGSREAYVNQLPCHTISLQVTARCSLSSKEPCLLCTAEASASVHQGCDKQAYSSERPKHVQSVFHSTTLWVMSNQRTRMPVADEASPCSARWHFES